MQLLTLQPTSSPQNLTFKFAILHAADSLVVSHWGDILHGSGVEEGVCIVDIDFADMAKARRRVPSLQHDRA
jgi:predicted amidohydrolase